MASTLTDEQVAVIDAISRGDKPTVLVQAGAGCGKSFTLRTAAAAQPTRRTIYTAFNKSLVLDARSSFPQGGAGHVRCTTSHGLAFGAVGARYKDRMDSTRYVKAEEVADILGLRSGFKPGNSGLSQVVHPTTLARLTLRMVDKFMSSADHALHAGHLLSELDNYTPDEAADLADHLLPYARKAWDDLQLTRGGRLRFEHAVYLKLAQLARLQLRTDLLMVDEAQDLSPVLCSLFYHQLDAQKVLVGDSAQAINGFTGAVDAMETFPGDVKLSLSQSFRFDQDIADEANRWLSLLRAPLRLRGLPGLNSRLVQRIEMPDAILTRTNAGAISQVMAQLQQGRRVALVGGGKQITQLAEAAVDLKAGKGTGHPELVAFQTWDQLTDYAENDGADAQLQTIVKLIEEHGPDKLIDMAAKLVDERDAEVTVSTAHKSKGREWDKVQVGDDFRAPKVNEQTMRPELNRDEMMLAYVTITRGRREVARGGLEWIDEIMGATTVQAVPAAPAAVEPAPAEPAPAAAVEPAPIDLAVEEPAALTPGQIIRRPALTGDSGTVMVRVPCHEGHAAQLRSAELPAPVRCQKVGCWRMFLLNVSDGVAEWMVLGSARIHNTIAA